MSLPPPIELADHKLPGAMVRTLHEEGTTARFCCFLQGPPKSTSIRGWMSLLSTRVSPLTSSNWQGARSPSTTLVMSAGKSAALTRPSQLASPRAGDAVGLGVELAVGEGVADALGDNAAVSVRVGVPLATVVGGVAGVLTVAVALGVGVLDGVGVALTVSCTVPVVDGVAVGAAGAAGAQKPPFRTYVPPARRPASG